MLRVIAHEGYRNGATRVLVDLLPLLRTGLGLDVAVEVGTEGPLAPVLRAGATVPRATGTPAVTLVNSALAADALGAPDGDGPTLVYAHEVGEALATLPPAAILGLQKADLVWCVSARAEDDLVALGVDRGRIRIQPPPISITAPSPSAVDEARHLLGASADEVLVVACGEATWRKGADHVVALAREGAVADRLRVAWVGRRSRGFARVLDHDTSYLPDPDRLRWFGEVDDAAPMLAAADVLVVTSREDPQPLVPLEAAMAGTPTVGFAGTGLDDFAAHGAAEVVPYPDVPALLQVILDVAASPGRATGLVEAGRALAGERTVEVVAARLVDDLLALVRNDPGGRSNT